jgi:hypothetical protein
MRTIYHIFTEENGEMDWFLDENYNVITYWWCNDAHWRGEYMGDLIRHFGAQIVEVSSDDKKHPAAKAFRKELKKVSG